MMSTCRVVFVAGMVAVLLLAAPAGAVNYNPNTTMVMYIHGFDTEGYQQTGVFGDDSTDEVISVISSLTGFPTWQMDPTAPNQVICSDYYGDTPPAWYTSADIAQDAAYTDPVPRYAMRMAKYIQHCFERAPGATGVTILGASFGGEISRYLIENDLLGLASSQKIPRWIPCVGVVRGNWAASNAPEWLCDLVGVPTPDVQNMSYSWMSSNISNSSTMNSALYAPMIISQFCATDDTDGYITALCNKPNDSVNLASDEYFSGYTTTAALHPATDGTLQMPTKAYWPVKHQLIADETGMYADAIAAATNNQRVTISLTRMKTLVSGETLGNGEWVFSSFVTSPRAAALYGVTGPIQNLVYSDGESIMLAGMARGTTKYPNWPIFDLIVPPGETTLNVTFSAYELDWFNKFYNMWEIGSTRTMGTFTVSINVASNNMITVSNGNMQADLTTTVKYVY